jgi:GT2 family glycosyltransferase
MSVDRAATLPQHSEDFPAVFALPREAFEAVGGFDESRFAFHMTEAVLGNALRNGGMEVLLVPEALAWHDIQREGSMARRLHLPSRARAFHVAKDRIGYIATAPLSPLQRLTWTSTYLLVLVPMYLLAILMDGSSPLSQRLPTALAFFQGTGAGVRIAMGTRSA